MPFNSVSYLLFLAFAVTLYWVLPARFRRAFVMLVSILFYASWGMVFLWVPLLVAALVFLFGWLIQSDGPHMRIWLRLGISGLLILLAFFKYRTFLLNIVWPTKSLLVSHPHFAVTALAFPMGISFFTFEAIAYLIDVRQGRSKMPGFLDLCLFFFFWPNILSGPIVRARELVPQLKFQKVFETRFLFEGLDRIVWGLVQKNVISNLLAISVDRGFVQTPLAHLVTLDSWFFAVSFGLQIYFDFAGYTNLAIGTARLIGVTLPENFRYPYHARTPSDFWNRWHLTLSRWIRDYLFFPINAKWHGASLPFYLSLIGVMALVGLWHGAGWNYIVWGSMHGIYLVVYRFHEGWSSRNPGVLKSNFIAPAWRVFTLMGVLVAWVVFRSSTLTRAGSILASMFYRFERGAALSPVSYFFTLAILLFCIVEPFLLQALAALEERSRTAGPSGFRIVFRPLAYSLGLLLFLIFDQNSAQFIYSQF